jgi:hypothetical protein
VRGSATTPYYSCRMEILVSGCHTTRHQEKEDALKKLLTENIPGSSELGMRILREGILRKSTLGTTGLEVSVLRENIPGSSVPRVRILREGILQKSTLGTTGLGVSVLGESVLQEGTLWEGIP